MRDQAIVRGITLRDFSSSFYLSRQPTIRSCAFLTAALALTGLIGCRAPTVKTNQPASLAGLSLLPEATQIVLALDLDRLRGQAIWKNLSPVLAKSAGAALDEIALGTGLEVPRQVHRLWIGLPAEPQVDGRFALVAETDPVNTVRATAWLGQRVHGELSVLLPNPRQVVISKGSWSETVAGLASAKLHRSAADNLELRRLCARAADQHAVWFAALVPTEIRRALMDGRFADVASLARSYGFIDDGAGLNAQLVGEFGNSSDPPQVAHRLNVLHNQAKRNPDMLVAGISPYLEALHVEARQADLRVTLDLPDGQAADVIERIESLARTTRTKYSPAP
jgi:hypothetical protein